MTHMSVKDTGASSHWCGHCVLPVHTQLSPDMPLCTTYLVRTVPSTKCQGATKQSLGFDTLLSHSDDPVGRTG